MKYLMIMVGINKMIIIESQILIQKIKRVILPRQRRILLKSRQKKEKKVNLKKKQKQFKKNWKICMLI